VQFDDIQYAEWRSHLGKVIKLDQDSIRFYCLWGCCQWKVERIGGEVIRDDSIFWA